MLLPHITVKVQVHFHHFSNIKSRKEVAEQQESRFFFIVSDPYSFFPDPDPEFEAGDQYEQSFFDYEYLREFEAKI